MKSYMSYNLKVQKTDDGIWKDFFRVNARYMTEVSHKIDDGLNLVEIRFTPVFGHRLSLYRAFQMEKEMGTEFTLEVNL